MIILKNPTFVISLDFEKMWGVFDKKTIRDYGENVYNVETVINRILSLFEKYEIHATWAIVGMLFHKDIHSCKRTFPIVLPQYRESKLSSYNHLKEICTVDFSIFYSGVASIKKIFKTPYQELATHTYSHFYCLEEGATEDAFCKDLDMSIQLSKEFGFEPKSIVFPRNQYSQTYLDICTSKGIYSFRGTERSWVQKSRNRKDLKIFHRIFRFLDSYINITGPNIYKQLEINNQHLLNIPASFFFRPFNPKLSYFEVFKISRLKKSMLRAARERSLFHLWWHPHNFGKNIDENLQQLESILMYYSELKSQFGMLSKTMNEVYNEFFYEK
jgi:peptidoglycan/xylan/chitin deacetylase (PgdA/CDA1 family)